MESCQLFNQILADIMILYSLYKKHHWAMHGATFYQLHLRLDQHAGAQLELIERPYSCSPAWSVSGTRPAPRPGRRRHRDAAARLDSIKGRKGIWMNENREGSPS
jgi:hypothetical protein